MVGMLALSLVTILEAAANRDMRRFTGQVSNLEDLLRPENLASLESVSRKYAFLAFHPGVDTGVRDYVLSGGLLADSGPNLLVFFNLDDDACTPIPLDAKTFGSWLSVLASDLPSYRLVRLLFEEHGPVPPLPGLVFFDGLNGDLPAVYVPLEDSLEAVRSTSRKVFSLADHAAMTGPREEFLDRLCLALRGERIRYVRTASTSLGEWLLSGYQFLVDHAWDIVALVKP